MNSIESLDELSSDELMRIRRTLRRRYRSAVHDGVIEVGFGFAERKAELDPSRREAICFLVQRKRMPRAKRDRIPAIAEVRVRRGRGFVVVRLPTDVIEITPSRLRLTRPTIRHAAGRQAATASGLVAWRVAESESLSWGLITVGHLFWHVRGIPEAEPRVQVMIPAARRGNSPHELAGRLIARTDRRGTKGVDAALIQVAPEQLLPFDWLPLDDPPPSLAIRPASALSADTARHGSALTSEGDVPFVVLRFFPIFNLIAEVGSIQDVLEVESPYAETFAPGRSGTLWTIERETACLQFAGWLHPTIASMSYRRGLGQSFASVVQWARERIAEKRGVIERVVDLRLVSRL